MKITKTQLKQIIKEELSAVLGEEEVNELADAPSNPDAGSPKWCEEARQEYEKLMRWTTSKDHSRDERDTWWGEARALKTEMEEKCPAGTVPTDDNAPPKASTTAKEAGAHTFSGGFGGGSQQAALEWWRANE
jgi:hypothetical protein